jgi:DNA (cytosine-5)-methyltransferase 1
MIRFGSVCSGIEAASVAWHPLGWRAAWLAEIEPFPCAVLAHHYPDVPNLGDMTTLPERIASGEIEAPDVFTGGTPCQAFSVAGKRESLGDARGNLSLTFCEIANAIDDVRRADGREPCVVVWENVPGVLSTADNAFGCFLGALAGADDALVAPGGRWSDAGVVLGPRRAIAWRVLDAQYFGLAQRRRRVFVVASARDGFDPAAVLLEFDGVRRDSAPRREAGEGVAGGPGNGAAFGGNDTRGPIDVATALNACASASGRLDFESETFITHTLRGEGFDASEDGTGRGTPLVPVHCRQVAGTVTSNYGKQVDSSDTALGPNVVAVSVALRGREGGATAEVGDDLAFTLRASEGGGDKPHVLAFSCKDYGNDAGELAPTLRAMGSTDGRPSAGGQVAVATYGLSTSVTPKFADNLSPTMTQPSPTGGGQPPAVVQGMAVRRLTPRECERLQGFPDDYTAIPWRKKPASDCPDGPRYKALGNSWAVPVAAWVGRRIDVQLRGDA